MIVDILEETKKINEKEFIGEGYNKAVEDIKMKLVGDPIYRNF